MLVMELVDGGDLEADFHYPNKELMSRLKEIRKKERNPSFETRNELDEFKVQREQLLQELLVSDARLV